MKKLVSCLMLLFCLVPFVAQAEDICNPQEFLAPLEVVGQYECVISDARWCYAFTDGTYGYIAMTNAEGVLLVIVKVDKDKKKEVIWSATVIEPPKKVAPSCTGNCA